jgi:16S rRNA (uracil1498-N3)-methyltransferase
MARRRFFVDRVHNGHAAISGDEAHHLVRVLRVEAGQQFEISDTHRVWIGEVESARKSEVRFSLLEEVPAGAALPEVVLCLSIVKFDRFEWAVEKATELGVSRIVPVETMRTDQGLFEGAAKRVDRWRRIAHEAAEQSRRLAPPEIADPVRFANVSAALLQKEANRFFLEERPGAPMLMKVLTTAPIALFIGPEGGWTDAERAILSDSSWVAASLGRLILRAETAVCAALSVAAQVLQ